MKLIGLTGGIATGKSTVSKLLEENGVAIIDADKIAREIVEPGKISNQLIRKHFGDEVFLPDGHLDRPKLGSIIFEHPDKRKILNQCTHPYVRREMIKKAFLLWLKGADCVVFDVPLLIESHLDKYMGTVVVVYCSDMLQLQRLRKRDQITEEQAMQRIKAQMPIVDKVEKADIILDNSSDLIQLENQVKSLMNKIRPSTATWLIEYITPPVLLSVLVYCITVYAPIAFYSLRRIIVA